MTQRELEQAIQDLFDGCLESERLQVLQNELRSNTEAREIYQEYCLLDHTLQRRAHGIDLLQVVPMDEVNARRQKRTLRNAGLLAGAALFVIAIVLSFLWIRNPEPILSFVAGPNASFTIEHLPDSDGEMPTGMVLEPGSRLKIDHGSIELDFRSGVKSIIRGPAELRLDREDQVHLASGTAWFRVPQSAIFFQVTTPELVLKDLGTEFGVVADPNQADQVHVFEGKVEIMNQQGLCRQEILVANQAREAGSAGQWDVIDLDPEAFQTSLSDDDDIGELLISKTYSLRQFAYRGNIKKDDLLYGLTPTAKGWNLQNSASPRCLTDGMHGEDFKRVPNEPVQGAWTEVGAVVEYDLGRSDHGAGWDLTSIHSVADWNGAGFGNQAWTVSAQFVENGEWRILATVNYAPLDSGLKSGGCTRVVVERENGVLAKGVQKLRFTAGPVPGAVGQAFVWREIDVLGQAAAGP